MKSKIRRERTVIIRHGLHRLHCDSCFTFHQSSWWVMTKMGTLVVRYILMPHKCMTTSSHRRPRSCHVHALLDLLPLPLSNVHPSSAGGLLCTQEEQTHTTTSARVTRTVSWQHCRWRAATREPLAKRRWPRPRQYARACEAIPSRGFRPKKRSRLAARPRLVRCARRRSVARWEQGKKASRARRPPLRSCSAAPSARGLLDVASPCTGGAARSRGEIECDRLHLSRSIVFFHSTC